MTIQSSRVTSKGQITIPVAFRDELDIEPGQMVKIVLLHDSLEITPYDPVASLKGCFQKYAKNKPYNKRKMQRAMEKEIATYHVKS